MSDLRSTELESIGKRSVASGQMVAGRRGSAEHATFASRTYRGPRRRHTGPQTVPARIGQPPQHPEVAQYRRHASDRAQRRYGASGIVHNEIGGQQQEVELHLSECDDVGGGATESFNRCK